MGFSKTACPYPFCGREFRKGDTLLQVMEVLSDPSPILSGKVVIPEGTQRGMQVASILAHAECVMQSMFGKHSFAMPDEALPVVVDRKPRAKVKTVDGVLRVVEDDDAA